MGYFSSTFQYSAVFQLKARGQGGPGEAMAQRKAETGERQSAGASGRHSAHDFLHSVAFTHCKMIQS